MYTYLYVYVFFVYIYIYVYKCVLVLSRPVSSRLVSSCLVLSRFVLSRPLSFRLVSSRLDLSCERVVGGIGIRVFLDLFSVRSSGYFR